MTGRAAAPVKFGDWKTGPPVNTKGNKMEDTQRGHHGEVDPLPPWRQRRLDNPRRSAGPLPRWLQARTGEEPAYGGRTLHDSWQPEQWAYSALREKEAATGRVYRGKVDAWKTARETARRRKIPFDRAFPDPPSGRKPRNQRRFGDGSRMFPKPGPETGPEPAKPDDGLVKDPQADRDAAIRAASKEGQSQRRLAITYGLSQSRIHQILRGLE